MSSRPSARPCCLQLILAATHAHALLALSLLAFGMLPLTACLACMSAASACLPACL